MTNSEPASKPRANWRWRAVVGVVAFLAGCLLFYVCVSRNWIPVAWKRVGEPDKLARQDGQLRDGPGEATASGSATTEKAADSHTKLPATAVEAVKPQAKLDVKPAARPPADPPPNRDEANTVRIDFADGEYVVPDMKGARKLVLVGRVKRLKVGLVDGASMLDASKLEAREVIFTGKIDGRSLVRLNATGGTVELRDKVDGQSTLEVQAPEGSVTFTEPTIEAKAGSKIDGDSRVTIRAKTVDLRGIVNGTTTNVTVTQTKGGLLKFHELAGGVHVYLRKAQPGDPEPLVEAGKIQAPAELKRID